VRPFRRSVAAAYAFLLCVAGVSAISMAAAQAASIPAVDSDIHISEVFGDGGGSGEPANDFIELTTTGAQDETLTGWTLSDDTDSHSYPIDAGTVIPAGGTWPSMSMMRRTPAASVWSDPGQE
jgi:hypothetical protein